MSTPGHSPLTLNLTSSTFQTIPSTFPVMSSMIILHYIEQLSIAYLVVKRLASLVNYQLSRACNSPRRPSLYLQQSIHFTMRLTRTPPSVHEGRVGEVCTESSMNLQDATIYLTPVVGLAMYLYQSACTSPCCFTWPIACSLHQDYYC
jgi:hypothetical protein